MTLPVSFGAVWVGALLGLGIALAAAVVFICLFWVAKNKAFSGAGQTIFEGFMFLIASYLITIVAFAMLKFKNYEKKLEAKLMAAANVRPFAKQWCHHKAIPCYKHIIAHVGQSCWSKLLHSLELCWSCDLQP